jgi:hypothetical protein
MLSEAALASVEPLTVTSSEEVNKPKLIFAAARRLKDLSKEHVLHETHSRDNSDYTTAKGNYRVKREDAENIINVPDFEKVSRTAHITFHALQEWEGYVLSTTKETFEAKLIDKTDLIRNSTPELAVFELSEVNSSDLSLLQAGAVFRWSIGYQVLPSGTKQRVSQIVFRRMPAWTEQEVLEAKAEASALMKKIPWE